MNHQELLDRLSSGDRRALARLISMVENDAAVSREILSRLHARTGRSYRLGMTGPPGAGKSTLVDELTKLFRQGGPWPGRPWPGRLTVSVIAVDPTSPFTGGAVLGDRVRMTDLSLDPGVFIRSMATRGSLGGLAQKAQDVADLLDAFGSDVVIFETVGVGQSELDIVEAADTTVVVLVPESGDAVQAMKAGLMEIADIFVVNKADREGADRFCQEIETILSLRDRDQGWLPPVVKTIAIRGEGIERLKQSIEQHREFLQQKGLLDVKRQHRLEQRVKLAIRERLREEFWTPTRKAMLEARLAEVMRGALSPYALAEELVSHFKSGRTDAPESPESVPAPLEKSS